MTKLRWILAILCIAILCVWIAAKELCRQSIGLIAETQEGVYCGISGALDPVAFILFAWLVIFVIGMMILTPKR